MNVPDFEAYGLKDGVAAGAIPVEQASLNFGPSCVMDGRLWRAAITCRSGRFISTTILCCTSL